ncbi:MAG: hypothetical protein A3D92_22835 [Bacteroidetes bacterium RIFCSPHIGHO2_02_FULL_44_7]|nr:MAG: hypothetical protein A3D92_22835 [Bacteroidetes bacterium RIFCSPHIGHO2_02_FULL_44_7]
MPTKIYSMKKTLLSLAVVASGFMAQAQVICAGISPANVVGNHIHTWADPAGGDWATPDYFIPGNFIVDTLAMVEDGTPGTNPQGNPISQEGCNALINGPAVTGKIAVIYRNTCEFGAKALNAQNAGAVGVIIINRDDEAIAMGGGADGLSVTIPVFMVSSSTGTLLTNTMATQSVVMFLGNKTGAYQNDVGASADQTMIAPFGGATTMLDNGFNLGLQLYNFGQVTQSNLTVTANIDGPSGNVYNQVINAPTLDMGDTLSIFNGNAYEFPPFDLGGVGNYPAGDYTLTYTLDMGITDDSDFDNVLTSTFTLNTDKITLARMSGGQAISNSYPSNNTTEYQGCMMFQNPNASVLAMEGVTFTPFADTTVAPLAGEEIFINFYEWNDSWVDLDDPGPATNNDWFTALDLIAFETYYPASNSESGLPQYVPFTTPFQLVDDQRYLVCLQTFSTEVGFGYDNGLNYSGNVGIVRQPVSPVHVDGTWYTGGWSGVSAPSLTLHVFDAAELGLSEVTTLEAKAFPNPATDAVTISINTTGAATLTVTDVSGKVAMTDNITFDNNYAKVNIDGLAPGVYVFNVALENGLSSQFNIVKK